MKWIAFKDEKLKQLYQNMQSVTIELVEISKGRKNKSIELGTRENDEDFSIQILLRKNKVESNSFKEVSQKSNEKAHES